MNSSSDIDVPCVVIEQSLRLRAEPILESIATVVMPSGTSVDVVSQEPAGWMRLQGLVDGALRAGWCMRQMLEAASYASMPAFLSAEGSMWDMVEQYTDRVGYRRGAKASSLSKKPPVIDCSGWVTFILTEVMKAQNADAGEDIFDVACIDARDPWSDWIILQIEARTPVLLEGRDITATNLPRNATIGLNEGHFTWQENHPRLRGINHIAQVVRRPADQASFVSESYSTGEGGVRLTGLTDWLDDHAIDILAGNAWAVDAFALADPVRCIELQR